MKEVQDKLSALRQRLTAQRQAGAQVTQTASAQSDPNAPTDAEGFTNPTYVYIEPLPEVIVWVD